MIIYILKMKGKAEHTVDEDLFIYYASLEWSYAVIQQSDSLPDFLAISKAYGVNVIVGKDKKEVEFLFEYDGRAIFHSLVLDAREFE